MSALQSAAIKAAGSASPYYDKAGKIVSVNVTDTYQCRIYFNNNYNCSLDDLTFPIVPSNQYASAAQFARAKEDFKPIGTRSVSVQILQLPEVSATESKSELFWDAEPKTKFM